MNATILIVETEQRIVDALKNVPRRMHDQLLSANTADEALELLGKAEVDVVISDDNLPDMLGRELLSVVGRHWPTTTRVLLTDKSSLEETRDEVSGDDVDRFYPRPEDTTEADRTIREILQVNDLKRESRRMIESVEGVPMQGNQPLDETIDGPLPVIKLDSHDALENVDDLLDELEDLGRKK